MAGRRQEISDLLDPLARLPDHVVIGAGVDARAQRPVQRRTHEWLGSAVIAHHHNAVGFEALRDQRKDALAHRRRRHVDDADVIDQVELAEISGLKIEKIRTNDAYAFAVGGAPLARECAGFAGNVATDQPAACLSRKARDLIAGAATKNENVEVGARGRRAAVQCGSAQHPLRIDVGIGLRIVGQLVVELADPAINSVQPLAVGAGHRVPPVLTACKLAEQR